MWSRQASDRHRRWLFRAMFTFGGLWHIGHIQGKPIVRSIAILRARTHRASPAGRRRARRKKGKAMDPDTRTRAAIEEHWQASERGDNETEHAIYATDAILDYPQSGE